MTEEDIRRAHAERFRKVSNRYPRRVAEAFDLDLAGVATLSDEEVAEGVAAWEREHGLPVLDWIAVGRSERHEERVQ